MVGLTDCLDITIAVDYDKTSNKQISQTQNDCGLNGCAYLMKNSKTCHKRLLNKRQNKDLKDNW